MENKQNEVLEQMTEEKDDEKVNTIFANKNVKNTFAGKEKNTVYRIFADKKAKHTFIDDMDMDCINIEQICEICVAITGGPLYVHIGYAKCLVIDKLENEEKYTSIDTLESIPETYDKITFTDYDDSEYEMQLNKKMPEKMKEILLDKIHQMAPKVQLYFIGL
jgi:hypothetical protein